MLQVRGYGEGTDAGCIDEVLKVRGRYEGKYGTLARKSLHSCRLSCSFCDPFMGFSQSSRFTESLEEKAICHLKGFRPLLFGYAKGIDQNVTAISNNIEGGEEKRGGLKQGMILDLRAVLPYPISF